MAKKAKKKVAKKKVIKKRSRIRHDWDAIFDYWVSMNIDKPKHKRFSYKKLSEYAKVNYTSVKVRAIKHHWADRLAEKQLAKDNPEEGALINSNERQTLEKLRSQDVNNEASVRQRHAMVARNLQTLAWRKLKNIQSKDLSVTNAIKLLEVGTAQERAALGITSGEMPEDDTNANSLSLKDAMKVINEIVPLLKGDDGVYDVESKEVIDVEVNERDNCKSSEG